MSSSLMMFWITLFSELSRTPSSSPILAIADTSSLEIPRSGSSSEMVLWSLSMSHTMGKRRYTRKFITRESQRRSFQCDVPMVLGTISENTRIRMVIMADIIPNQWSPVRRVAWWPTAAAPRVFAMVLRDRMADRGRSGSCLNFIKRAAFLSPSSSFIVI